jgi:IS5 family transposase
MRPRKRQSSGCGALFRARLDQIINMKHGLVRLAEEIDWDSVDGELADLFSAEVRPGTETRFMMGLLLLKQTYGLSGEGGAIAKCTTPISSIPPARRSPSTPSRTSARG